MKKINKFSIILILSFTVCIFSLATFKFLNVNNVFTKATYSDNDPCGLPEGYNELDTYVSMDLPSTSSTAIDVKTRGTITNVVSDSNYQYGYMQRTNPTSRELSSIYLYKMPLSPSLSIGDVIDVEAKAYSYYGLNEIVSFSSLTKLSETNPNPAIPYELNETNYSSFVVENNLSRLVKMENITLTSIGDDVTTNSYNIQVQGKIDSTIVNICLLTFNATKTNEIAATLRTAMNNGATIDINRANIYYYFNVCYLHVMSINDIEVNNVEPPVSSDRELNLYAINDFHGAVNATSSLPGIEAVGGYIKDKMNENENSLAINSGDMWQGNIESNFNYGEMLTKVSNNIGFAGMALGNHEFDWGPERIIHNKNIDSSNPDNMKILGANIYNYVNGNTTTQASELCDEYVIKTMPNGLRVGVIGVIGKDQITSILSPMVEDYIFLDPTDIIIDLANDLRTNEDCDIIVVSAHTDQKSLLKASDYVSDATNITNHVDAIFCAHTHQSEVYMVNGTPIVQGLANGKNVSNIKLSVDESNTISVEAYQNISYTSYSSYTDEEINDIVSEYTVNNSEFMEVNTKNLGVVSGDFSRYNHLSNMLCTATYEYAKDKYDASYVIVNTARSNLYENSNLTYGTLFTSLPFENEMVVADVNGDDLEKELGYSSIFMYRKDKEALDPNKTYRIICIDYVLYHQNSSREYNYFPDHTVIEYVSKDAQTYMLRDIVADYILNKGTILNSNYDENLDVHNKTLINEVIS